MTERAPEAGWLHNVIALGYGSVFWVIATLGLPPSFVVLLQTRGRQSGKVRTTILMAANHEGERYLVSVTGDEAQWVRNARAANGDAFVRHGSRRPVRLEEVPVEQRAPMLKAYLKWALGARPLFEVSHKAPVVEFERIASRHPVFRIIERRRQSKASGATREA